MVRSSAKQDQDKFRLTAPVLNFPKNDIVSSSYAGQIANAHVEWCACTAEESFSSKQPQQLQLHLRSQECVSITLIGSFLAWAI